MKAPNDSRTSLLTWLVLPAIGLWLSTNYLVGLNHHPSWDGNQSAAPAIPVSSPQDSPKEPQPVEWDGQALISFWLDDAWATQFTVAFPILDANGYDAALAVPTKFVGSEDYLSWAQLKLLQFRGWEITSHTRSHSCDPYQMTDAYVEDELHGALDDLNAHGLRAQQFVTPCGVDSPTVSKIARQYYLSLRTSFGGVNPLPIQDPYRLKVHTIMWTTTPDDIDAWIEEARENKAWLILVFHQFEETQSEYATTPELFRSFVQHVRDSHLKVVLPIQALQLVTGTDAMSPG